jgi:hypothetical protein
MRNIHLFSIFGVLLVVWSFQRCDAQIPNAGFENWTAGNPDSWIADNTILWAPVTQSTDAHSGSSAAAGTCIIFDTFLLRPSLTSGTATTGFPVNSRFGALHGWYKFAPVQGDDLLISAVMSKGGIGIGGGIMSTTVAQSTYTEFVANIVYINASVPDTCRITITIASGGTQVPGSAFVIDDLSFGSTSAVDDGRPDLPKAFDLAQNYPNPFNPTTKIQFTIVSAQSGSASGGNRQLTTLKVYDVLGREVATLVNEVKEPGTYTVEFNASSLASGVYFYRLTAGSYVATQKMILMR